ncbi:MAG: DNA-directed RNA polymerase subunit L [Methanomassiliicoccaceae archaeon]|nr:DNA-directed RNA polymerase subunit L [Methanomassiliicoccaceae archaeon]
MDAYIVEKTDKTILIGFKSYDPTVIEPMMKVLNDDKNVALVRYIDVHPELSDVMLYIEVSKGKPEEAVKKAAKAVSAYFSTVKQ